MAGRTGVLSASDSSNAQVSLMRLLVTLSCHFFSPGHEHPCLQGHPGTEVDDPEGKLCWQARAGGRTGELGSLL